MPRDTCVKPQGLPAALQLSQKIPPAAGAPIKAVAYLALGCASAMISPLTTQFLAREPSTGVPGILLFLGEWIKTGLKLRDEQLPEMPSNRSTKPSWKNECR
jgi:hypothetical protein